MKFTTTQKALSDSMAFVASAIERKTTLPILANVLIEAANGKITLSGTNTELEKRTSIEADVKQEGTITVPAQKFFDFAKNADPDKNVTVTVKDGKAAINSGRRRWNLSTLPADQYPEFMVIEGAESLSVDISELAEGVKRCSPTMAVNDVRYYLNGMLFEAKEGKLNIVATDGHRLGKYSIDTDYDGERAVIVPRQAVTDILKMLGKSQDAYIEIGRDNIKVTAGDMVMYSKLVDGKFPDYNRVIPRDLPISANLNTDELSNAVKCTLPLTNPMNNGMRFTFADGQLTIESNNAEQETAVETMPVALDGADSVEIGFNGQYMATMLGTIEGENITLGMRDGMGAVRADEGSFTAVVMPIRM